MIFWEQAPRQRRTLLRDDPSYQEFHRNSDEQQRDRDFHRGHGSGAVPRIRALGKLAGPHHVRLPRPPMRIGDPGSHRCYQCILDGRLVPCVFVVLPGQGELATGHPRPGPASHMCLPLGVWAWRVLWLMQWNCAWAPAVEVVGHHLHSCCPQSLPTVPSRLSYPSVVSVLIILPDALQYYSATTIFVCVCSSCSNSSSFRGSYVV